MATTKAYYEKNKEAIREYQREYRAKHPEKWREKNRLWRNAHPEEMRISRLKYYATPKGKYTKLKLRARAGGIPIDIKQDEFIEWYENQVFKCYYCRRKLNTAQGQKKLDGYSIDRKDNNKGYSLDNIVVSCNRCNMAKGSWFTEEEMLEIAKKYFHCGK